MEHPTNKTLNDRSVEPEHRHSARGLPSKQSRLVVVVRVTTRCAQSCHYCGFSNSIVRDRGDIDLNALIRFGEKLRSWTEASGTTPLVSWLGGEPYQWRDLWIATNCFRHDFGIPVSLTTNGVALAVESIRQRSIETLTEVTISIDGPAEHHDRVRSMSSSFEQLKNNCCNLVQEDTEFRLWKRINTVLTTHNIGSFTSTCHELASWGINEITFNPLGGNDRPEFFPANRLRSSEFERFCDQLPSLRDELQERGVHLIGSPGYIHRIASTIHGDKIPIRDCKPASRFLFIDERGRISPCSFTSNQYFVSLDEACSFENLTSLERALSTQRELTPCTACADCHANHVFEKFDHDRSEALTIVPRHQGSYCV